VVLVILIIVGQAALLNKCSARSREVKALGIHCSTFIYLSLLTALVIVEFLCSVRLGTTQVSHLLLVE
jgi:hypothetical protein